eukprot:12936207-Prorocentrum_lima.AAC.1
MASAKARAQFRQIVGEIETEPWETDVHTQCGVVVAKVKEAMQKAFPRAPTQTHRQLQPEALRLFEARRW